MVYDREDLRKIYTGILAYYLIPTEEMSDEVLDTLINFVEYNVAQEIVQVGHDLNCAFCGFKDNAVQKYLDKIDNRKQLSWEELMLFEGKIATKEDFENLKEKFDNAIPNN